jgi:hypothetical protein
VAKFLMLILIAVLGWLFFFKKRKADGGDQVSHRPSQGLGNQNDKTERIVLCAVCGVNIPESESVTSNGRTTCQDPATCKQRPAS